MSTCWLSISASICRPNSRYVQDNFIVLHFHTYSYFMFSSSHSTHIKFSTSRFLYMHIWNDKIPKLSTSLTARLLCYSNYWYFFNLWMGLSMIPLLSSHTQTISCSPYINCNLIFDTIWQDCPSLHSTLCPCIWWGVWWWLLVSHPHSFGWSTTWKRRDNNYKIIHYLLSINLFVIAFKSWTFALKIILQKWDIYIKSELM